MLTAPDYTGAQHSHVLKESACPWARSLLAAPELHRCPTTLPHMGSMLYAGPVVARDTRSMPARNNPPAYEEHLLRTPGRCPRQQI